MCGKHVAVAKHKKWQIVVISYDEIFALKSLTLMIYYILLLTNITDNPIGHKLYTCGNVILTYLTFTLAFSCENVTGFLNNWYHTTGNFSKKKKINWMLNKQKIVNTFNFTFFFSPFTSRIKIKQLYARDLWIITTIVNLKTSFHNISFSTLLLFNLRSFFIKLSNKLFKMWFFIHIPSKRNMKM